MKAILEFDLPEERDVHLAAIHALDWKSVVQEMDEYFRSRLKYHVLKDNQAEAVTQAREQLHQICSENGLNIHE